MAATFDTLTNLRAEAPDLPIDLPAADNRQGKLLAWRKTGMLRWLAAMTLLVVLSGGASQRWWAYSRTHVTTDNAFVAGDIHQISSRLAGTIAEVLVQDNQRVSAGTSLLRLDEHDLQLRVEQGRHQVAQAAAQLTAAEAQLQQARAHLAQGQAKSAKAAAELNKARLDDQRAARLTEGGRFAAISRQERDAMQAALEVAQASVSVAEADLQASRAQVHSSQAACAVAQAQHRAAEVDLADAQLQLSYAVISAPVAGVVGRKTAEVGQRVQPGQALAAVVADQKWLVANFKETQLARMQVGQRVEIRFDAIPGKRFVGQVESFAPASGAQFALLPPDNATGNFTKVVQRVPVKIVFLPESVRGVESKILAGLSAVVAVEIAGS